MTLRFRSWNPPPQLTLHDEKSDQLETSQFCLVELSTRQPLVLQQQRRETLAATALQELAADEDKEQEMAATVGEAFEDSSHNRQWASTRACFLTYANLALVVTALMESVWQGEKRAHASSQDLPD